MKYAGLRNQLAALRAQLPLAGLRIVITGGMPETATPAAASSPPPEQLELPLPKPPPSPSAAAGRVFVSPGPLVAAETAARTPLTDPEPAKPDWEQAWWREQRRLRRP